MSDKPFNIRQLDGLDYDEAEPLLEDYQETLIELFVNSPEGEEYGKTYPDVGSWISQFIYYAFSYEGFTLPCMKVADVETVIEDLFPRKVTLLSPEDGENAIPELLALWQFLKREFKLQNATSIIKYLRDIEPEFQEIMEDSSKFGFAKSFVTLGHQAGFDMSTEEGLKQFQQIYNAKIAPTLASENSDLFGWSSKPIGGSPVNGSKASKAKQKKAKNMAAESRKRNRTKKK
ncbi:MAG: hypothetical protein JGK24_10490 [Microcoleus sp. PH2017_29_MFU_D_A]|uniref:hypothetical protein n=1 Tax=unclassified Microcoleus TaxID=2642155 RepID=UPI001D9DAC98|nr:MULTISPECIES: hypothetical protein [unclassified Microcoleus]MCC3419349.1 hypothetical protein [Microcoleus sp. PH2017_07_MST_O_A]MCC3433859.1 hypothetical protein [Microcoleus sp. PH2017_04_SCI_O_A]MCC3469678.1 hypothetical protein [Microcoleus sp. PH2017_06_SFM_O_A]MCC3506822.1 hypothetical protein [Microcoleus sp. PH2017_19_SFW_U_A]MCC3512843.1 hypothetical protein [Microcoleus sp. PH2017_17_BER_D_A]TAE09792.1 MAG: hypothetical protein EAZ94_20820 [Oscillatoriales cyanobacterium]